MANDRKRTASAPLLVPHGLKAHRLADDLVVFELPLPKPKQPTELTPAEMAVATLVYEGLSNRQIAEERGVSVRTISNQLDAIFRKLDVQSRVDLIIHLREDIG